VVGELVEAEQAVAVGYGGRGGGEGYVIAAQGFEGYGIALLLDLGGTVSARSCGCA
jgi:hypothetical protein